jgi:hypothetical protein
VSASVQRPRAGRYRSGVSRKSIVGTAASVHGSKAVGVACLKLGVSRWVGDWQFYLSPTGACAPVARWPCDLMATLSKRGGRHGIIADSYRASNSRVRGALWKALYVHDGSRSGKIERLSPPGVTWNTAAQWWKCTAPTSRACIRQYDEHAIVIWKMLTNLC